MSNVLTPPCCCPTCGAKTVEYRHTLNVVLVSALKKLANAGGGPTLINSKIGLSHNEAANFQKMRYWPLVRSCDGNGLWEITDLGRAFLAGEIRVSKWVRTYRGATMSRAEELVSIHDYDDHIERRAEYAEAAKAHQQNPNGQ